MFKWFWTIFSLGAPDHRPSVRSKAISGMVFLPTQKLSGLVFYGPMLYFILSILITLGEILLNFEAQKVRQWLT